MQITRDIEKYTQNYANGDLDFENILVKYRRKKVLEVLEQYKPRKILEIGCGYDSIVNYYTDFDKFVIVEPAKEFAQNAIRDKKENIILYIDFLENKINELKNEHFDFIILSSLLHEIVNPQIFLKQVTSLCNKSTILHINVPNSRSFHLLWAYESGLIERLDELTPTANMLQQNTAFGLTKLIQLVQEMNLSVVDKGSYFVKPFNHKKMIKLVNENIIDDKLLEGLYSMTKYIPDLGAEVFVNCRLK